MPTTTMPSSAAQRGAIFLCECSTVVVCSDISDVSCFTALSLLLSALCLTPHLQELAIAGRIMLDVDAHALKTCALVDLDGAFVEGQHIQAKLLRREVFPGKV